MKAWEDMLILKMRLLRMIINHSENGSEVTNGKMGAEISLDSYAHTGNGCAGSLRNE